MARRKRQLVIGEACTAFDAFMQNAFNLDQEMPRLFGPSQVPGKYTSRLSLVQEIQPEWQESIKKLNELAVATHRSWAEFIGLVRTKWPDLIVELHTEGSPDS